MNGVISDKFANLKFSSVFICVLTFMKISLFIKFGASVKGLNLLCSYLF